MRQPPRWGGRSRSRDEGGSRRPDCGFRRAAAGDCPATLAGSRRGWHDCWTDSGRARLPEGYQRQVGQPRCADSQHRRPTPVHRRPAAQRRARLPTPGAPMPGPAGSCAAPGPPPPCRKSAAAPPAPGRAPPPAPIAPVEARGISRKLFNWPAVGRAPAAMFPPGLPAPVAGRVRTSARSRTHCAARARCRPAPHRLLPAPGRAAPPATHAAGRAAGRAAHASAHRRRTACPGRHSTAACLRRHRRRPRRHLHLRHLRREQGCRPARKEGPLRRVPRES